MQGRGSIRVAAAQPTVRHDDLAATVAAHAQAVRRAGSRLVVFPELSLTGYAMEAPVVDPSSPALAPLIEACREVEATALVGAPVGLARGRGIGVLAVDADGARVAYIKMSLGGAEPQHFVPGVGPAVVTVGGWRVGVGVYKDTRIGAHLEATSALGIDLYVAGLVHHRAELPELEERAGRPVVLAGFAGPTGGGYAETCGGSGIWAAAGARLTQCGPGLDEVAAATLVSRRAGSRSPQPISED